MKRLTQISLLFALALFADAQAQQIAQPAPCTGDCTIGSLNFTSATVPVNGVYLSAANTLNFSTNSASRATVDSTGNIVANNAAGYTVRNAAATSTLPTLVPNRAATNTGIGAQAANNMSEIAGGVEIWRATATGPLAITLPTDATTNDNTMCVNTTTHIVSSGTGTLGICLGTSSARYKTGIAPLIPGLQEILALSPKSFYLDKAHGDPKKQMYGFIAEDMINVLPKLVSLDKAGRPNSADYLGVVPVLVRAMQQQQAEIATLTAKVSFLENRRAK